MDFYSKRPAPVADEWTQLTGWLDQCVPDAASRPACAESGVDPMRASPSGQEILMAQPSTED
jgi:hypothetical protein